MSIFKLANRRSKSRGRNRVYLSPRTAATLGISAAIALAGCGSTGTKSSGGTSAGSQGTSAAATTKGTTCSPTAPPSKDPAVAAAQKIVSAAAGTSATWAGPTTGPKAVKGKLIVYVANTMSNAGDAGVYAGLKQAASHLGWTVKGIDGGSSPTNNIAALDQALALKPAAIGVSSIDTSSASAFFQAAKAAKIPVIGNHTGNYPGFSSAVPGLFTNITSQPALIAKVAVACAIVASNGTAGVTISSCGSEAPICLAKEQAMQAEMKTCPGCKLLAEDDFPFEDISQREGGIAAADYQKFGKRLTYMLSINDAYADSAIPALTAVGVGPAGPPQMIAAGDGSPAAFARIRTGQFQIATVAEPLNEHGWQMADEINRALNGQSPSNYVTYPHLVTIANVNIDGGQQNTFNPPNGYEQQYMKIWGVS
jgi:ribose transport system substrate-binding protein